MVTLYASFGVQHPIKLNEKETAYIGGIIFLSFYQISISINMMRNTTTYGNNDPALLLPLSSYADDHATTTQTKNKDKDKNLSLIHI